MLRVLIVDDEPLARENLRILLETQRDIEIVGECGNAVEAIGAVHKLRPDVLFLDIQMPRISGLEMVGMLDPEHRPYIVFLTAFDEYAVKAFEEHAFDYLLKPIEAARLEKTLARASKASGDSAGATQYDALANARQQAIEKYLWNDKEGWYADYDLKTHKVRNQLTAAALFPLYVNAASRERATKVAAAAESRLLKPGGLTTTTVNSGQQWDAPNGWAPLQWVAVEGLQNYGQQKIAMEVTWRFLTNVQHTYDSKQKLVEKYDVSSTGTGGGGGEYPLQDGFGWTNGVTLKMLDLICPQEKPCDALPATRPATTPSPQDKPVAAPAANDPAPAEPQKTGS